MKRILIVVLLLILCSSIGSSFSFANLLGYVTKNNAPTLNLISPKNNGVANQLIFTWGYKDIEDDPQTQFLLQLDDDWRFESPYEFYGLDEKTLKVSLPLQEGDYYWRVKARDAYGWGEWSDWRRFDLDLSIKTCSDGTPFWQCSSNVPRYCDGGDLVEDCRRCGCGINEICQQNGICLANTCIDGSRYGDCSKYKPKFCQNGKLIEVCSLCGCPSDLECNPDGSCSTVKIIIKEEIKEQPKTLLNYIVDFFKKLFGSL
jgi:hypothetical protein